MNNIHVTLASDFSTLSFVIISYHFLLPQIVSCLEIYMYMFVKLSRKMKDKMWACKSKLLKCIHMMST